MPQISQMLASVLNRFSLEQRLSAIAKFAQTSKASIVQAALTFAAAVAQTAHFQATVLRAAARLSARTMRICSARLLLRFWRTSGVIRTQALRPARTTFADISSWALRLAERAHYGWQLLTAIARSCSTPAIERIRAVRATLVLFMSIAFMAVFTLASDGRPTILPATIIKRTAPIERTTSSAVQGAFIDRFTRLDERRWNISDRGSNGAWTSNDFPRRNVAITPEGLVMTISRNAPGAPFPFSGAEIATHADYEYGYFEVRMRTPRGGGIVTGVFTYARPEGRASWHEIDIEVLGRNPRRVETTRWFKGRSVGSRKQLWFDASEDFHTYAFEWTPTALRWYVDNNLVEESTDTQTIPRGRQNFFINLWISEELDQWVGPIDPDEAPWRLTVSCAAQAAHYSGRSLCPQR